MADVATGGIAAAAGVVAVGGNLFGIQYDALLFGFFGGLVSLSYLPPMSRWRVAGSVGAAALMGGALAPLVAAAVLQRWPFLPPGNALCMAAAAVVGLLVQVVVPATFVWIKARGAKQ